MNPAALMKRATIVAAFVASITVHAADPLPRGDPGRAGFSAAALERIDRSSRSSLRSTTTTPRSRTRRSA
jgi:hypothetical protein